MNLIERSQAFREAAGELDALRASATIVQATGSRASQLELALAKLRLVVGKMKLLHELKIEVSAEVRTAPALRQRIATFKSNVAADPSAADDAEFNVKTLGPLGLLADRIDTACLQAWAAYVRNHVPRVNADLVQVLRRVTVLRARIDSFNAASAEAAKWETRLPTSREEFDLFERLAADCSAAWQAVGADGIPRQVATFLQQATTEGGAEFASYAAVEDWIREHGLETSLVIRIR